MNKGGAWILAVGIKVIGAHLAHAVSRDQRSIHWFACLFSFGLLTGHRQILSYRLAVGLKQTRQTLSGLYVDDWYLGNCHGFVQPQGGGLEKKGLVDRRVQEEDGIERGQRDKQSGVAWCCHSAVLCIEPGSLHLNITTRLFCFLQLHGLFIQNIRIWQLRIARPSRQFAACIPRVLGHRLGVFATEQAAAGIGIEILKEQILYSPISLLQGLKDINDIESISISSCHFRPDILGHRYNRYANTQGNKVLKSLNSWYST